MLTSLSLNNFRCFGEHSLELRPFTVIVGRNNAGKSTIAEALRLVSIVASRLRSLKFTAAPEWTDFGHSVRGVSPSTKGLEINFHSIFYRYQEPPASIIATFETGERVCVFIGPKGSLFATIEDQNGKRLSSAKMVTLPSVAILPQITALAKNEERLTRDYVRGAIDSHLSSLHFRNQLVINDDLYAAFKDLAESTWPHLRVRELAGKELLPGEGELSLLVQDGGFTAEIGWMGHGLQMWLQMVWFLIRAQGSETLILDEPDVYLHADLQRKLLSLLRTLTAQVIIATHSVEIIEAVEPDNVLVVDKQRPRSRFATSLPAVQRIISHIGSAHNIQLARLWSSRKCLLVEGKDVKLLSRVHSVMSSTQRDEFELMPHMSIQGWSGWNYAIGSSMALKNNVGRSIVTYCLLDRDFHRESDIEKRLSDARERGIQLHIWKKKEIENYFLVPEAIARYIVGHMTDQPGPSVAEVAKRLDLIANQMRTKVTDAIAVEILAADRKGLTQANRLAREFVANTWKSHDGKLGLIYGKDAFTRLSAWSQETYNISFSPASIAATLHLDEIDNEMQQVIEAISEGTPLSDSEGLLPSAD